MLYDATWGGRGDEQGGGRFGRGRGSRGSVLVRARGGLRLRRVRRRRSRGVVFRARPADDDAGLGEVPDGDEAEDEGEEEEAAVG